MWKLSNIPLIQIGFTPEALSDFDGPYRHQWELSRQIRNDHHRLDGAADGSEEMG